MRDFCSLFSSSGKWIMTGAQFEGYSKKKGKDIDVLRATLSNTNENLLGNKPVNLVYPIHGFKVCKTRHDV